MKLVDLLFAQHGLLKLHLKFLADQNV